MIENLEIKTIAEAGPVYLLGAGSYMGKRLIQMLKENNIRPSVIWDEDFLKVKYLDENKSLREDIFSSWNLIAEPVPNNFDAYPKGSILVAAREMYQRNWMKYAHEHGSKHIVYDGFDIVLFPVHSACENNNSGDVSGGGDTTRMPCL
jgi:hypothetical protein